MKKIVSCFLVTCFLIAAENQKIELVDISKMNPNIKIDCVYATTRNFTKKQIYLAPKCYLRKSAAEAIDRVQKDLEEKGLGLLIWDAYRPMPAQLRLWDAFPDARYVGNPNNTASPKPHIRGMAVDLTIIRLSDGKQLDMGTGHDDFSEKAWAFANDISDEAKQNRKLLQEVMTKYGFQIFKYEWWHFNFEGWQKCPFLLVDFDQLA